MTSDRENRLQDSEQTLDVESVKERIRRNKKRVLETIEVENKANAKRKNATDDGNKRKQDVHDDVVEGEDYPFEQEQAD